MAIQFAPKSPGVGENIGGAIGEGLDRLIQRKIADIQKKRSQAERKETYKKAKLPQWLAELDEDKQDIFLKQLEHLPPEQQEQFKAALNTIPGDQIMGNNQNEQPEYERQPPGGIKPVRNAEGYLQTPIFTPMGQQNLPNVQQPAEDFGSKESIIPGMNKLRQAGEGFQRQPSQAASTQSFPERGNSTTGRPAPQEAFIPREEGIQAEKIPLPRLEKQVKKFQQEEPERGWQELAGRAGSGRAGTPDWYEREQYKDLINQRKEAAKEKVRLEKESAAEQKRIEKETLPIYKKINDERKAATNNDIRLGRIKELNDKGHLPNATFYSLMKRWHVPTSIYGTDALEFEKLSTDFLKDAKAIFGSRLTDQDLIQFMKTVPTLENSRAGNRAVIRNLELMNKAAKLRGKAMDDIIKENGGRRPEHLESLIEERVGPLMDKIAAEFAEGAKGSIWEDIEDFMKLR